MRLPGQAMSALLVRGRTLQLRLALFYSAIVFASGVVLLSIPNGFVLHQSSSEAAPSQPFAGVGHPTSQRGSDVHQLAVGSVVALIILVPLSFVLGWFIAGHFLRPLRTITATARDISASNLHRRLALAGSDDEFKRLGQTLDDLFGRLEASFESQRRFVANASHELRTPLTAERTLLQVALADPDASVETLRATCAEILTLGEQQERLIDALLTLASSERGVEQWESIDLADVVEDVLSVRQGEVERRGLHINAMLNNASAFGDPSLVESLVANLLDNALHHNVAGGQVTIVTATQAAQATLSICNTGPLVPATEIDRLFQPFQQLGNERIRHHDGHGLGLAIVHAIAQAHGATLSAKARPEGGLEIEVRFPSSAIGTAITS
ncbi:MAG TPA: HAMP domain-containing sensor histidine kinase [Nitrolancea sp.]|nr:HAMP domain-containing sensor histidine kinase [Nitrolancea sp.]